MFRILRYPFFLILLIGFAGCAANKKAKLSQGTAAALNGKELFTTNCVSCHALQDDGIGPPLGGITSLLSKDVLTSFITNPGKFIEAGDERAVSLSRRYKLIMPPFDFLKKEEINAILGYIEDETKVHGIKPLIVKKEVTIAPRLAAPVTKSGLQIELEDFVLIPPSSDKMPRTRIANMRPHPSGDGTLYVSDQRGIIHRIENGQVNTFLDIRPLVENYINEPGLGTGLGSFAFHPDYLNNGLIYLTHTEAFKGKKADYEYADSVKVFLQWVVSEWKNIDVQSPVFKGERRELVRINVPGNVHGTQDIGFVPGLSKNDKDYGMLYIGTGDGGSTIGKHPELCHSKNSLLGTIIRIDPLGNNSKNGRYGIPADNPFVNDTDPLVRKEIYAYGFRNPHRMSWHMTNGKTMFSTEVGESNFEEINIIQKGGDYGWNVQEGNYGISPKDLKNVYKLPGAETAKTVKPFALYDHIDGNAISGGYVYEGKIDALKDKYIFGDIVNGRIFYVNINKALSDSTVHEMMIVQNGNETSLRKMSGSERVDVRIEYDGFTKEMYVMTKSDGRIRRISKAGFSGNQ
ncbi:PQQ-dependent sugar dehydrogenase [Dyadobacter bucti]|uniref:PQQ-dependent sugar dehydrogenase n=1 Tax=Dyadobacter bucti TaxID=2572203 RepID=UPI001108554E|nr:PQQ-dependent sugar dehydrogenase [Dyadobacter bucti]